MKVGYLWSASWPPLLSGLTGSSIHVQEFVKAMRKKNIDVFIICANKGENTEDRRQKTKYKIFEIQPNSIFRAVQKFCQVLGKKNFNHENTKKRECKGLLELENSAVFRVSEVSCFRDKFSKLNLIIGNILKECDALLYNFKFFWRAKKIISREHPDLLYERYALFNYSGIKLARWYSIPIILEVNALPISEIKTYGGKTYMESIGKFIEKCIFKNVDAIVAVSSILKKNVLSYGIPEEKVWFLPNGVDIDKFNPDISGNKVQEKYGLQNKVVIGFVGTLVVWHNLDILIDAMGDVIKKIPNIYLLIVGDGFYREPLEKQIESLKLRNYVTITGCIPHNKIPDYINAIDIAVDLCDKGDLSMKLFEYMAMGRAIVSSNVGQISEMIKHGENGMLVQPGDKKQLVETLISLAANLELRTKLGKKARKTIENNNYTWEKNVDKVCEIYKRVKLAPNTMG